MATWRETGGPAVAGPTRKGFGSRLIVSSLNAYGEVDVLYEPQGLILMLDLPLSKIQFRSELVQIEK